MGKQTRILEYQIEVKKDKIIKSLIRVSLT